jgi:acyl-CoA reductase-like NAD-dependent aldehyde dehydrogenase
MTTHAENVATGVGLVIGGDVEAGGDGTYSVTNPARPGEVVVEAPATSPAQLDRAVGAAKRSQATWAALDVEERAALVLAAAEAGVAAVEAGDLARLLTREHGKTYIESIFDTATMAGMAAAFARLWPTRWPHAPSAGDQPGSSGCRTVSWPPSCPSTGRCR